jgi:hypothetical protein
MRKFHNIVHKAKRMTYRKRSRQLYVTYILEDIEYRWD